MTVPKEERHLYPDLPERRRPGVFYPAFFTGITLPDAELKDGGEEGDDETAVVAETVDSPSGSLDSSKVSHAQIQMKNQYNEMVAQIWVSC